MEQTNTLEQPIVSDSSLQNKVDEPITNEEEVLETIQADTGSDYGKFKDATSLLNAYNSLEKEFTKKSQKLSELLKEKEASTPKGLKNNYDNVQLNEKENVSSLDQNTPIYKQSNWRAEVSKFLTDNPDAKNYTKEISEILLKDKSLANSKDCLKYAYALASKKAYVEPAKLLDDPAFLDSLSSNEKLKEKIISNYLKNIAESRSNLRFISGEPKNISPTPTKDKPKNLKEASNILKRLLQS